MTDLEKLLAEVTPGPWWSDTRYDGREMGCAIIAARTDCGPLPGNPTRGMVAWSSAILNTESRRCEANARLIAMAPDLARKVIAAEHVYSDLRDALKSIEGKPVHAMTEAERILMMIDRSAWEAAQ